ncbi:MAG: hypothetical protein JOZ83_06250 [Silvibacterium sp.]|nr:hypothetical protein [Silvibacterium sp.]
MLPSVRQMALAILAFAVIPMCFAQRLSSSALSAATDSASTNSSSSRIGVDLEPAAGTPPASAEPSAEGAVRNQRPAYAASRTWLFAENGIGTFVSPLGLGIGAATTLSESLNLRATGNLFGYNVNGVSQGVNYQGDLSFRSVQAGIDWFPWRKSFHLSPGVLFYNQNRITVHGGVAAGESFTVNGATYYSGAADPVTLYGNVNFRRTSPMLTLGWGNWLPRSRAKHFSFPVDIGFAYVGELPLTLTFTGVVCDTPADVNCRSIDSDPTVQQNIAAQRKKYQNDLDYVRFYPIISTGVSYKF